MKGSAGRGLLLFRIGESRAYSRLVIVLFKRGVVGMACCGQVPKWPKGADCKSAGLCLPRFESLPAHQAALARAAAF
ncbi:protein of unknown function [Candidatus Nitrospira inopinata]|uniref:Uncharacterized protein n=1 Tax=Candidatus Nitrospira inopinata TaxID=1715989 RepID=A0A0S4KTS4_9BACT|nr:protein of unknown function [Candidatus Nitrospira inopinata]